MTPSKLSISNIATTILAIGLFLLAIDMLGLALGELAGSITGSLQVARNPFIGLFIGLFMTAILHSSSTTTSVAVAAVASGSIQLESAIPIILGANIGTTITSTVVAFGYITKSNEFRKAVSAAMIHDMFNILGVLILFPLELRYHFLQKLSASIASFIPVTSEENRTFWIGDFFDFIGGGFLQLTGPVILLIISVLALFGSIKLLSSLLYKNLVGER
ncbi:MAG: Na/Pi symporter, partial [Cyclobacteriaceae bacterium]